jgi:hypothetical protein
MLRRLILESQMLAADDPASLLGSFNSTRFDYVWRVAYHQLLQGAWAANDVYTGATGWALCCSSCCVVMVGFRGSLRFDVCWLRLGVVSAVNGCGKGLGRVLCVGGCGWGWVATRHHLRVRRGPASRRVVLRTAGCLLRNRCKFAICSFAICSFARPLKVGGRVP